jgi:hypothetical protein
MPPKIFAIRWTVDDIPIFLTIKKKITIIKNVPKKLVVVNIIFCSSELNIKLIIRITI